MAFNWMKCKKKKAKLKVLLSISIIIMQGGIPTLPVLHTSPSQVKPPHFVRFPSPLLIYTSKCLTQEIHAMTVASAQSTV